MVYLLATFLKFIRKSNPNLPSVDPEAAQSIFSNPVLASKTTLITLDLTHQCLATKTVRQDLLFGSDPSKQPSQLRTLLHEILEFFAGTYDEFFDIKAGPPLHDPLAVAVLFGFPNDDDNNNNNDESPSRYAFLT